MSIAALSSGESPAPGAATIQIRRYVFIFQDVVSQESNQIMFGFGVVL